MFSHLDDSDLPVKCTVPGPTDVSPKELTEPSPIPKTVAKAEERKETQEY